MKVIKTMSIVGIVLFSLFILILFVLDEDDLDYELENGIAGWGVLLTLYGFALAIVGLVQSVRTLGADKQP